MNCSPLRGIRAEPLTVSPIRMQHSAPEPASALDTSLDDEFAAQQQMQLGEQQQMASPDHERKYDDDAAANAAQQTLMPTLAELAAESIPSDHDDDAEAEEAPRTPFSLPTPTPLVNASTPSFSSPSASHVTPSFAQSAHATPSFGSHSAHATPSFEVHHQHHSSAASMLVTPPNRVFYNRFATPVAASPTPVAAASPHPHQLTDYKGTPIDRTMRRNLISADAAAAVNPDAFRSAAAAALSVTAPRTLLNTLASPSKSAHLRGLESQMARLHSSHRSHAVPFSSDLERDPTVNPASSSLLSEEQSSVEIAEDAVEEMGKAAAADDEKINSDLSEDEAEPQARGALLFTPMAAPTSAAHSTSSTPFLSPAAFTPREPAAAAGRIIRESTPVSLAPRSQVSRPSAPLPAPDSQRWSVPVELSKLAEKQQRLGASRYNLGAAAREDARKAQLLHNSTAALNAVSAPTAAAPLPLPKISPPTPEQWQRERASQPMGKQAKSMAAGLAVIKSKVAMQRRAAATAAGVKTAPASAPTARSRPSSTRPSTHATAGATPARVPLATLALNFSAGGNPWLSAADRAAQAAEAEKQRLQQQQAAFATPLKRMAATVSHTPSTVSQPENIVPSDLDQFRATPEVFHLPAPLSPPAQPAQSYRALVNGVHIVPPALSWIASHHTTEPERIHANLRFITTAYAHAD